MSVISAGRGCGRFDDERINAGGHCTTSASWKYALPGLSHRNLAFFNKLLISNWACLWRCMTPQLRARTRKPLRARRRWTRSTRPKQGRLQRNEKKSSQRRPEASYKKARLRTADGSDTDPLFMRSSRCFVFATANR
jgi:hypothetical protein